MQIEDSESEEEETQYKMLVVEDDEF